MSPTLSSPHASPILTSTPLPARRTFTRLTASTPCRTTTPCTPSVTSVAAPFPLLSPSSLEAGALHYPSPPPSLLRIRRIPLNLTTTNRNLLYNRSPPQRASLGAATLRVLSPANSETPQENRSSYFIDVGSGFGLPSFHLAMIDESPAVVAGLEIEIDFMRFEFYRFLHRDGWRH